MKLSTCKIFLLILSSIPLNVVSVNIPHFAFQESSRVPQLAIMFCRAVTLSFAIIAKAN